MSEAMDVTKEVEALVKKVAESTDSNDALKFSQAASNAANAMACLLQIGKQNK